MKLSETELIKVSGGATAVTSAMINALVRGATLSLDLGRIIGTAIFMAIFGKKCSM